MNFTFLGGAEPTCLDAAHTNDDNQVDISDAVAALGFPFTGGGVPPAPGSERRGLAPAADPLMPCLHSPCD